jgi:uncharacterized delta-60 repeat protein
MTSNNLHKSALIVILSFILLCFQALAQDGSLDLSFDQDGFVMDDFGGGRDDIYGMKLQPDGKIVVVGSKEINLGYEMVIGRFNSDGSWDTSFDTDGFVIVPLPGQISEAWDVAIQNDGKILATGYTYDNVSSRLVCVRLDGNGNLDASFGSDGIFLMNYENTMFGYSIALQNDDKIVIGGNVVNGSNQDIVTMRLNSNGTLDTSFSFDGFAIEVLSTDIYEGSDVAIQND